MLISNRHGFLYVHIAGTGGTRVRSALEMDLWSGPRGWTRRLGRCLARNFAPDVGFEIPRHAPIIVARELLPLPTFTTLFKFSFVRNPWDRLIGSYRYFQVNRQQFLSRERIDSFGQFVEFVCARPSERSLFDPLVHAIERPQLESLIGLRGELLIDFVGRHEHLRQDFHEVCSRLGLPTLTIDDKPTAYMPHDYRGFYTDKLAERVGKHYADDLAAFQYRFDDSRTNDSSDARNMLRVDAIAGKIHL